MTRALDPAGAGSAPSILPAYVVEVLQGAGGPVFLVDLEQMLSAVSAA